MNKMTGILTGLLFSSLAAAQVDFADADLSPYFQMESQRTSVVVNGSYSTAGSQTRRYTVHLAFGHPEDFKKKFGSFDVKICTGVLIHPEVIVTSAHCAMQEKVSRENGELYRYKGVRVSFGFGENDPDFYQLTSTDIALAPAYYHYDEVTEKNYLQDANGAKVIEEKLPSHGESIAVELDPHWASYNSNKAKLEKRTLFFRYEKEDMTLLQQSGIDDLALVFLPEPARLPFKPVKILHKHNLITHKLPVIAAGFGADHFDYRKQKLNSPRLRFSENGLHGVYLEPNPRSNRAPILRGVYSFPTDDQYACIGDSGGPSLVDVEGELQLVTVMSSVEGDCAGLNYGVTVAPFTAWIESEMQSRGIFDIGI